MKSYVLPGGGEKRREGRINDQVVDWLRDIEKRGIECKCVSNQSVVL